MAKFHESYKKKSIRVIGILLTPADVKYMNQYKKEYNIKFPILYGNVKIVEEYHIEHGVPAFFFIDKNGMVKKVLFGETTLEVMEELVDEALKPIIIEEAK